MAASDEFPRNGIQKSSGSSTGGIVLPALPSIIHVITNIAVKIVTSGAGSYISNVSVTDSADGTIATMEVQAPASSSDSDNMSGPLQSSVGGSISLTWAALGTNAMIYEIEWYDI